ncbi:MAG: M48 family metalloprotease [Rhizobiales bacterium]|nr:M48 family metalloprotease [Hyphomicrobiales bacterium]
MIQLLRNVGVVLSLILLTACAKNLQNTSILGDEFATAIIEASHLEQIGQQGGINLNKADNLRLENTLRPLLSSKVLSSKNIVAILLKNDQVNAYSLSNQSNKAYIYFTDGLLKFIENDQQLAAVAAHELAHIYLSHHLQRLQGSSAKFNRVQEFEADKLSIKLLIKAGYNGNAAIKLLRLVERLQTNLVIVNKQDYPTIEQRIANITPLITAN